MREMETGKQLPLGDLDRMLRALSGILSYLYRNYGEPYEQTEREVTVMIKSFIDPEILRKGKLEGKKEGKKEGKREGRKEAKLEVVRNMIALGYDTEMIGQITKLAKEEIERERAKAGSCN